LWCDFLQVSALPAVGHAQQRDRAERNSNDQDKKTASPGGSISTYFYARPSLFLMALISNPLLGPPPKSKKRILEEDD
jgi:hypothetical protein